MRSQNSIYSSDEPTTAPTALPVTSIAALATLPAILIGAVTICVHPEKINRVEIISVIVFIR